MIFVNVFRLNEKFKIFLFLVFKCGFYYVLDKKSFENQL